MATTMGYATMHLSAGGGGAVEASRRSPQPTQDQLRRTLSKGTSANQRSVTSPHPAPAAAPRHPGSQAVLQVLGVVSARQPSSTRRVDPQRTSKTPSTGGRGMPTSPTGGARAAPVPRGRISPSPSSGGSVTGRSDALSGEIVRSKLQSIMMLREQIEQLAAKHRTEEEALTNVLNSINFGGDEASVDGRKTQSELLAAVQERDRTIEMLDTFRREGSAVIQRLHDSLRKSAEQNVQYLAQIEGLSRENESLKEELKHQPHHQPPQGPAGDAQLREEYESRVQMYLELLNQGDEVIRELRQTNETLTRELAAARAAAGSEQAQQPLSPSEEAKRVAHLQRRVDELQDQLRAEQLARLQSEEQSHVILQEHRRNNELLEQRIAQHSKITPRQVLPSSGRRSSTSISGGGVVTSPLASQRSVEAMAADTTSMPPNEREAGSPTVSRNVVVLDCSANRNDITPRRGAPSPPEPVEEEVSPTPRKGGALLNDDPSDVAKQSPPVATPVHPGTPTAAPHTAGPDDGAIPTPHAAAADDDVEHQESLRKIQIIAQQLESLKMTLDSN